MFSQTILIGNLGADPEIRHTPDGQAVCALSVATGKKWTDKQTGEAKEHTEWHRVVVWGKSAEACSQFLQKGSKVFVQGENQTRKWTDDQGIEHFATEVVLQNYNSNLQILTKN